MLLSVTSKPISSPAETGPTGFAAFCTLTSGQLTVTLAFAELFPVTPAASLVAEAEAVFDTGVPQLAEELVACTCTVVLAPAANVVGAYCNELPTIDQPALAGLMVQVRPEGKESVKLRPLALPVPMLLNVTSKPMTSPAETGPTGFAAFCTLTSGHWMVTLADAELLAVTPAASLFAEAEAVFETEPQLAEEVVACTCTVVLAPAFKVVGV